ncbi:Gfo/Idh/MocA family protein [Priestia koreensis]|uniref:Gfo/Idh/MocA family protein n=1 Tax=Priestia koreensis TaxID=284581 RepID=UPI00345A62B4
MTTTRVGVIGAGSIAADAHIPFLLNIPHVTIAAIADLQRKRAEEVAAQFNIPSFYRDAVEMLEKEKLDGVFICTSNHSHIPLALEAAKRGVHVFIEKPIGVSLLEVEHYLQVAKTNHVLTMVGMTHRFRRDVQIAKEFIERGDLGDIYHVNARFLRRRGTPKGWFTQHALSGGGAMMDTGVHVLDLAWYLLGEPKPLSVSASSQKGVGDYKTRYNTSWSSSEKDQSHLFDVEDFTSAYIRFHNKANVNIQVSWAVNGPQDEDIVLELFGTKGGLQLTPLTLFKEENHLFVETRPAYEKNIPFADELQHFISCIRTNEPPLISGMQGLAVLKMIQAIYESSRTSSEQVMK